MIQWNEVLDTLNGLNKEGQCFAAKAKKRWDQIGKPIDGLGRLETAVISLAKIQRTEMPSVKKRAVIVFCSDNGVVEEQVTQTDQSVTAIVTENLAKGLSTINVMAKQTKTDVIPVDIGVEKSIKTPGVIQKKVRFGTKNITKDPAMTKEEAFCAIEAGIHLVKECKDKGYEILAAGEMGIGNTTTSSAVASVLLNLSPSETTGKGAGLPKEGIQHKISVIEQAIKVNQPDRNDPMDILCKLGGFDLAGMVGMYFGGALYRMPIVLDGFISAAAALLAVRISNAVNPFLLASHVGKEPACKALLQALEKKAILHGEFALGEGTGAILLFPLLDTAFSVYEQNLTFDQIQVEAYQRFEDKK